MSIKFLEYNKIIFDYNEKSFEGEFANSNDLKFIINEILKIDKNDYEYIYKLNNGWAGAFLFIKENTYRWVTCGSGVPILSNRIGIFVIK